ncbi:uncharacterized protein PG998_008426 [Apiospora kogelbergensis]|uniref:uncharacterized protein n=1 Tax=Apiospora kogelbergensis TaxID=1337665 RepID=UPI00312D6D87
MRYKASHINSKEHTPLSTISEDASSATSTVAVEVIPQDRWERAEGFNSQIQDLRKHLNGDVVFPSNENWSLMGLVASKLYCAIPEDDRRRTEELRKRQFGDRQAYQLSIDVFLQEPDVVAAELRYLVEQVRTMRAAPGGTVETICRHEREWLRLIRHADGIHWHINEAAGYANQMRACSDQEERMWLAAELNWLIVSHANTIYWHFIQLQMFGDES